MKKIARYFKFLALPLVLPWLLVRVLFFSEAEMLRRLNILTKCGEVGDIGTFKRWFHKARIVAEIVENADKETVLSVTVTGFQRLEELGLDGTRFSQTEGFEPEVPFQFSASVDNDGASPSLLAMLQCFDIAGWYRISGATTVFHEEGFLHERFGR